MDYIEEIMENIKTVEILWKMIQFEKKLRFDNVKFMSLFIILLIIFSIKFQQFFMSFWWQLHIEFQSSTHFQNPSLI